MDDFWSATKKQKDLAQSKRKGTEGEVSEYMETLRGMINGKSYRRSRQTECKLFSSNLGTNRTDMI